MTKDNKKVGYVFKREVPYKNGMEIFGWLLIGKMMGMKLKTF